MYIHEIKEWPHFTWENSKLTKVLSAFRHRQGRLIGRMESLGFILQSEAILNTMSLEILKSNEIEGELLDSDQVRSSVARHLGLEVAGILPVDRNIEGIVEIMIDATQNFILPLTDKRLFEWYAALFPSKGKPLKVTGGWRKGKEPMQVVSGIIGREKIHFEAPAGSLVPSEMKNFLEWFNSPDEIDAVLKAGIAHLWFVTIHPFADGNGRLARTITEMQLSRGDGLSQRFYSMSAQIRLQRKEYYNMLEKTQKGSLDISEWLEWFLICLDRSLDLSESTLTGVKMKSRFWELHSTKKINDRQRHILNKLQDNFEGKLTSSKYAKIAKCSPDTALRDIQSLIEQGMLTKEEAGGRSTNYVLKK